MVAVVVFEFGGMRCQPLRRALELLKELRCQKIKRKGIG
ncbi:acetyltransferase [Vibrio cholerae]|nr:acetyltransferase [Vibrio cholerae]